MIIELERLFAALVEEVRSEAIELRGVLVRVLFATVIPVLLILFRKPSIDVCVGITFVFWIYSIFKLFSVQRFILYHISGEVLEIFETLVGKTITATPVTATGAFDNTFIRIYWKLITSLIVFQTIIFLLLPLYVNYTYGGVGGAIIICMLMVVIAYSSVSFFSKALKMVVTLTIVIYSIGVIFLLFPHIGFYLGGLMKKENIIHSSTAKKVNELESLQAKQQEKMDNEFIEGVIAWQKKHPGESLPPVYQVKINRARKLKLL